MGTKERIGRNVRTIARGRSISMRALSKRMGYNHEQVLYTRLSGETKMSVDELEQLAEILGVPAELLLSDPSTLLARTRAWVMADSEPFSAAA